MEDLKAVIDTNILVSILKGSRSLSPIYAAFKEGRFKLVISDVLLRELADVLSRPRLTRFNLKLAKSLEKNGVPIVYVKIKGIRRIEETRLINPHLELAV